MSAPTHHHRSQHRRHFLRPLPTLAVLLLICIASTPYLLSAFAPDGIRSAWQTAQRHGSYQFRATIIQQSTPLASAHTVGQISNADTLQLHGSADLRAEQLRFRISAPQAAVAALGLGPTGAQAIEVEVERGLARARQGDGSWQVADDLPTTFAPGGDMFAFLAAARDVQQLEPAQHNGFPVQRYTFTVDGPAFAKALQAQLEYQLSARKELAPGARLDLPAIYRELKGSGELLVDANGLPVHQKLNLVFPPDAQGQTSAQVSVDFFGFAAAPFGWDLPGVIATLQPLGNLAASALPILAGLGFALLLVVHARSRPLYRTVVLFVTIWVAVLPLTQASVNVAAAERRDARATQNETAQAREASYAAIATALQSQPAADPAATLALAATDDGSDRDGDGSSDLAEQLVGTNPIDPHSAPQRGLAADNSDSDGDGLSNYQEQLIGTVASLADSDSDGIPDGAEITGVTLNGTRYSLDPNELDSNRDGIGDGQECDFASSLVCADTDGDKLPDAFERDNDNDGVPDSLDLSPDQRSPTSYSADKPMHLALNGLEPGELTYVEFQLRTDNPAHMRQAFNVFDWPQGDDKGQVRDVDGAPFGTSGNSAYGDMRLVPMLEITIDSNITNLPDAAILSRYNISVQEGNSGSNTLYAYVPLQLATDPQGEAPAALYGKMLYMPGLGGWGQPHKLRLLWLVQGLNDVCSEYNDDRTCKTYEYNKSQVLQTYDDSWSLAGFAVRENRSVAMATIYQEPSATAYLKNDAPLFSLADGLDRSFLSARASNGERDMSIVEIKRRFDAATNGTPPASANWGLPDIFAVRDRQYEDLDTALMSTSITETRQLLDTAYPKDESLAPTLLFVREERYRAANLALGGRNVFWQNNTLTVDFLADGGIPVQTFGGMSWAPFRYNQAAWEAYPIEDYWVELQARTAGQSQSGDTDDIKAGKQLATQLYYIQMTRGLAAPLAVGNANLTDNELVQSDAELELARSLIGVGIEQVVRVVNDVVLASIAGKPELHKYLGGIVLKAGGPQSLSDIGVDHTLNGLKNDFRAVWKGPSKTARLAGAGNIFLLVANLAGTALLIAGTVTGNSKLVLAGSVILLATLTVAQITGPIMAVKSAYQAASSTMGKAAALRTVLTARSELVGAAKVASVVGLVISIGVAWGVFLYQVIADGLKPGSIAFNTALSQAISATLVAVYLFVLGLTVVGAIIVGIIGIVDLLLQVICAAGVQGACFSIIGKFGETIGKLIYSGEPIVDTERDDLIVTGSLSTQLRNEAQGLRAGNGLAFGISVQFNLRHKAPAEGSAAMYYDRFWTFDALKRGSFAYELNSSERTLSTSLGQMPLPWNDAGQIGTAIYKEIGGEVHVPLRAVSSATGTALSPYQELTAGLNKNFPLYFNLAYALPSYDCWVGVCEEKNVSSNSSSSLGDSLIYDIFPASLADFVKMDWDPTLKHARDNDGDGLLSLAFSNGTDPDDTTWDSDGDGLADGYELNWRSGGPTNGGAAVDPTKADTDGDGLNDFAELLLGSQPDKADSDNDGLNDNAEVVGYDMNLGGLLVRATSDPRLADSDSDGLRDATERNLYNANPTAYPYHPRVPNRNPLGLVIELSDRDGVVLPGTSLAHVATVANSAPTDLYATGGLTTTLPAELGGTSQSLPFDLLSGNSVATTSTLQVPAGMTSKTVLINNNLRAALHTPAPENTSLGLVAYSEITLLTIDNDAPTAQLGGNGYVPAGRSVVLGGSAADPTSAVARVEIQIDNGEWQTANGAESWSFGWAVPAGEGPHQIKLRTTDVVGNLSQPTSTTVYADNTPPTVTVPGGDPIIGASKLADGRFAVALGGTASDPQSGGISSGVEVVEVLATPHSSGWQRATINGGNWTINYPLSALDGDNKLIVDPSGSYSFRVRARDRVGNITAEANYAQGSFRLDATPPLSTLVDISAFKALSRGNTLSGTVNETGVVRSGVAGLEISFTPAELTAPLDNTLLSLALDEGIGATRFESIAANRSFATCPPGGCPTSGGQGRFGNAASFAGSQYLSVPRLDVPESGYTLALWFKTNCIGCGIFSVVEDQLGAAGSDRNVYLSNGNVCVDVKSNLETETICSSGASYADNQWHAVAHVIGNTSKHQLWIDGNLAASGLKTASTFASQSGVVVGFANAANSDFLNGAIDETRIFNTALSARQIKGLYQSWQPVGLGSSADSQNWNFALPDGLEDYYQIDLRARDGRNNRDERRESWGKWRGEIDTTAPRATINVSFRGNGNSTVTDYSIVAEDLNLTTTNFSSPCSINEAKYIYNSDRWATLGRQGQRLKGIEIRCSKPGFPSEYPLVRACDLNKLCTTSAPPVEKIFWSSTANPRLEQANALDGLARTTIYQRDAGQWIWDVVIDQARGWVFWLDSSSIVYRANLDGSNVRTVVPFDNQKVLTELALNSAAGKLYWLQYSSSGPFPIRTVALYRANLDGSQPQFLFNINNALQPGTNNALTLDTLTGKIYWYAPDDPQSAVYNGAIYRANFDGTQREMVRNMSGTASLTGRRVREMVIDAPGRKMYWIDSARDAGVDGMAIWTINIDNIGDPNSSATRLTKIPNQWSLGLALDSRRQRLFWGQTNDIGAVTSQDIRSAYITSNGLSDLRIVTNLPATAVEAAAVPGVTTTDQGGGSIFTYNDIPATPLAIPEFSGICPSGAGLVRTFNVPQNQEIVNFKLGLNISHPRRGDLVAYIQPPGYFREFLAVYFNPDQSDNLDVLLDYAARNPVNIDGNDDVGPPYYYREARLQDTISDAFNRSALGAWTVRICDVNQNNGQVGQLNRMQLILTLKPAAAVMLNQGQGAGSFPIDYQRPTLDSAIITPSLSLLRTDLAPLTLNGAAYGTNFLKNLTVTANGTPIYTQNWANGTITNTTWTTNWTPPGQGVYTLQSQATDWTNAVQTQTYPVTVTVSTADPTITVNPGPYTAANQVEGGMVALSGTVNAVADATIFISINPGNFGLPATRNGNTWQVAFWPDGLPDNKNYTVSANVADRAGRFANASNVPITIDVASPDPFTLTPSVQEPGGSWTSLALNTTIYRAGPRLALEWGEALDGSGLQSYYAGWTSDPTPNIAALTAVAAGGTRRFEQVVGNNQILYGHVVARDNRGNERAMTFGPLYIDAAPTPDLVADLRYRGWMQSGATLIGVDRAAFAAAADGSPLGAEQRLYATWDANALRLAYSGANWDGNGDLFIYLDSAAGGATTAYNPFGTAQSVTLPGAMAADYAIWVRSSSLASLLHWNGSAWAEVSVLDASEFAFDSSTTPPQTDLRLLFNKFGVTNPAGTALKIVAFATSENLLSPWATIPDKQPLSSGPALAPAALGRELANLPLRQAFAIANLGNGIIPNAGRSVAADLQVSISANQPAVYAAYLSDTLFDLVTPDADLPNSLKLPGEATIIPLADGEVVNYTLRYRNDGGEVARGVTLSIVGEGGMERSSPATVVLGDVAAGASGEVQISAIARAAGGEQGAIRVAIADSAHGSFEWLWVRHSIDNAAPGGLAIEPAPRYARPGFNTIGGSVRDASGVPMVTLEIEDVPGGATRSVACVDTQPFDERWDCRWDAGALSGVSEVRVRARATDGTGRNGDWTEWLTLKVDLSAPTLIFDTATEQALADGLLSASELDVAGTLSDNDGPERVELCFSGFAYCPAVRTLGDGNWRYDLSSDIAGDGVESTLRAEGSDAAGNLSVPVTRNIRIDTVAPVVTIQQAELAVLPAAQPIVSGTVSDGGGVASVAVKVSTPQGTTQWYNATLNGGSWLLQLPAGGNGRYSIVVEARDTAGNRAATNLRQVQAGAASGTTLYLPLVRR